MSIKYLAIGIPQGDDGRVVCDRRSAVVCLTEERALQVAEMMAEQPSYTAAVAIACEYDKDTGAMMPAEVLRRFGYIRASRHLKFVWLD